MGKHLLALALPLVVACGAAGKGGGEPPEDFMEPWEALAARLATRPGVAAEARLGASEVIFVDVTVDHGAVVAESLAELDTGLSPELLNRAPHPVQFRITIPALEGRYWWGEYDRENGNWVGMATHAQAPHPDLEPRLAEATGTFVVALPTEG
ncbi:MAG: hypothetical protein JSU81_11420 [Candidatus Coatesbacteria bacterium]|nr:MAG: hypothetical protein JSU81_11420 [Candidatus Coatesbacteria bacterium]